jgi:hypothetical protein
LKAIPKQVDAERKRMRDTLDELKNDIRKPLTEWEEAEEERKRKHEAELVEITGGGLRALDEWDTMPLDCMVDRLGEIEKIVVDESWEEYEQDAENAKRVAITNLKEAIERRRKYDAEQAELEELRKLKAEQEKKDREEALRREGEEKAKREAEAAVEAGKRAKEAAERREAEAKAQAAKQAEAAAQAERDRIEAEQNAEKEAAAIRERNTQHRGKVNRAAKEALMEELNITENQARSIVNVIKSGRIPYIEINY